MTLHRTFFVACVLGLHILAFSACLVPAPPVTPTSTATPNSIPNAAEPPEASPTAEEYGDVSFMVFGDDAEFRAYRNLVDAFERKNPAIKVGLIYVANQFAYRQRLNDDLVLSTPTDVVLINNRRYATYAMRKWLEPLGPYLARSSVVHENEFFPQALDAFRFRGQLVCVPQNLTGLVVYFNKDLFDQAKVAYPRADWTWDDFLKTARALTRDTNGDGKVDQYGLATEGDLLRVAPFIWQNGGELVDNPTKPTRLALDAPAVRQALQWIVELQVKYHVVPNPNDEIMESFESRFMHGSIAMFINGRHGVGTYRDHVKFNWDVAPLPRNKTSANSLQSDAYCMPRVARDKAKTWRLIEFAVSPEGQTILATSGRSMPSLMSLANANAFLQPDLAPRNSRIFLDGVSTLRDFPIIPYWVEIEETAGEEVERAFHGEVPLDTAIQKALDRSTPIFSRQ